MKTSLLPLLVLLCTACAPNVQATPTTQTARSLSMRFDASNTCEGSVARNGHTIPTIYCTADIDSICAEALLSSGYSPVFLHQCRNVQGICAASQINANQPLTQIGVRCRM